MPVYQYEAMDNTGTEVKDTIEAGSEAEAQQKIKEQGFFVTKISEKGRGGKKKDAEKEEADGWSEEKEGVFVWESESQTPLRLHTPTLDTSGRRPAYSAKPENSRRTVKARAA